MSEHKVQGGDMLLFIDPTGGTNYDTVVCLTSVSQTDSVSPIDASSACGPDKSPGAIDMSISFEGQHLQDPSTGLISGTNLLQLLRAEQTIGWKLSPVSPVAGDEIQEGTGYLSELSSTYSYSDIGLFSGTIQPYGIPTSSIQTSKLSFEYQSNSFNSTSLFYVSVGNGNVLRYRVYWGDGTFNEYDGDDYYLMTHTYPSLSTWIIELEFISTTGTNLTFTLSAHDNHFRNVKNINLFANHVNFTGNITLAIKSFDLTSEEVNDYIYQCIDFRVGDAIGFDDNTPPAPPTGQGLIDKSILQAKGVGVYTD